MPSIINFQNQVIPVNDILLKQVEDSYVLLNLKNNTYYGLESVAHHCYSQLVGANSIQDAFEKLAEEYQITPEELREDLIILIQSLIDAGIVSLKPHQT